MRTVTSTGKWRHRGRGWVTALVASLLLAGLPASMSTAADGDTGSISGTVTDDEGTPLAGVDVSLQAVRTTTGPDGTFSLAGLAPAVYRVWFRDPDQRVLSEDRPDVRVAAGAPTRLDVVLQRPGVVTGTVVGPDGPLDGWPRVRPIGVDGYSLESYDRETGEFVLLVEPGRFSLSFSATGLAPEYYDDAATLADAALLTVAAGETVDGIDVVLGVGTTISGRVTDVDGAPVAGIRVFADPRPATGGNGSTETEADGSYTIAGLGAGAYLMGTEATATGFWLPSELDAPVRVPPDEVVTGVDLVVEMGGRITGTVGPEGAAAIASVFSPSPAADKQPYASTAPDGSYSILVPAGDVVVGFRAIGHVTEYHDDAASVADAQAVPVTAGETVPGIDATLSRGAELTGRVTDPAGAPVADLDVRVGGILTTTTDSDGRYTLTGLVPGVSESVTFRDPELLRFVVQWHEVDVAVTPVLDVTVEPGGIISGRVTDTAGRGASVNVRSRTSPNDGTQRWDDWATGTYSLLVPAGTHVIAFDSTGDFAVQFFDDVMTADAATPVTVGVGETVTGVDAVLSRGGTVAGVVTDGTGAPVGGLGIALWSVAEDGSTSSYHVSRLRTATDGSYRIDALNPGRYRLRFEDPALRYLDTTTDVTVAEGATTTSDVQVTLGGRVTGTVTGPQGVVLGVSPQVSATTGDTAGFSYDSNTGRYTVLLPAGEHVLRTGATGYLTEYYDDALTEADATPVRVVAGEVTTGIDVRLSVGATVTGVVQDSAGRPIADARVTAGNPGNTRAFARTGADGRFALPGQVGETIVCAQAEGFIARSYPVAGARCSDRSARGVILADGESHEIAITLPRPASLSGRVEGPVGEIPGAWVGVTIDGERFMGHVAPDGSFTVDGLPPGAAVVYASPDVRFDAQYYDWSWDEAHATAVPVPEGAAVTGIDMQLWYADLSRVFTDVGRSHPFVREISWMKANGITTGNVDGSYGPTAPVTRGAMAAFLYRMAGEPSFTAPTRSPFRDVSRSHTFYTEICWLASTGITGGYTDGTFRPGTVVERRAMAAFLYRYAGSPAFTPPARSPFSDVAPSHPFYREIAWLAAEGVAGGYTDGTYRPRVAVDRQAMAAFLNRLDRKVLD